MKRCFALSLLVVLALAVPAGAKEPTKLTVCGATDCRSVFDRSILRPLVDTGPPTDPPRHAVGWYRATVFIGGDGGHGQWHTVIVPSLGLIRTANVSGSGGAYLWAPMTPEGRRVYRELTSTLAPMPATALRGLDSAPPSARIAEVLAPPGARDEAVAWPWIVGAAVAVVALASGLAQVRSGRSSSITTRGRSNTSP